MDEELKKVVEAILFAAGRKLELAELASLCKKSEDEVLAVLTEWKALLDSSNSPTMLMQDGSAWKLTVREKYVGVIKKVVTKTELPKGQLETLAVVSYKAPVLQSKVVKIRTNKAYDHLAQLENSGFITREKSGRSKLIKLTPKFFEYFDIDPSKLKQKFTSAGDIEKAIEAKETEIEGAEVAQRKETAERLETPQIVLENGKKPLETYPVVQPVDEMLPTGVQVFMEKLGSLEVFDVPREEIPPGERPLEHKHKKKKKHEKHAEKPVEPVVETPEMPVEAPETPVPEIPAPEKPKAEKKKRKKSEEKPAEEPVEVPEEKPVLTTEQKISQEAAEKTAKLKPTSFEEGKGLFPEGVPPEVEAKIEEKIKRLLSGEPEEEK